MIKIIRKEMKIECSINPKIVLIKNRLINFHLLYVKNFAPELSERINYLTKIREVNNFLNSRTYKNFLMKIDLSRC